MSCDYAHYSPYILPTIDFVGGETQNLLFHMYFRSGNTPFPLSKCSASFSIVDFLNKTGAPILTKTMNTMTGKDHITENALTVKLLSNETVNLSGKYIYQISIQDSESKDIEIPKQGILFIHNNIHKGFIKQL